MEKKDIIDEEPIPFKLPTSYNWVSVLSFIGNGVTALVFVFLGVSGLVSTHMLSDIHDVGVDSLTITYFTLFFILSAVVSISCMIGLVKMRKGQLKGLYWYLAANGGWMLLLILYCLSGRIFLSIALLLISGVFEFYFYSLKKYFQPDQH